MTQTVTEMEIHCIRPNNQMIQNVFLKTFVALTLHSVVTLYNLKPYLGHIFSQSPLCPSQEAVPPCGISTMYMHEFYC